MLLLKDLKRWIQLPILTCLLALPTFFSYALSAENNVITSPASFLEKLEQIREISDIDTSRALIQVNSLKAQLNEQPIDEQLEYYHLLAEIYTLQSNYRLGKAAAEQGLLLASSLISPRIIIAKLSYDLGFMLESLGDIELALKHYMQGLDIAQSLEEQKEIAIGLTNIGAIYYQTNRLSDAILAINEAAIIAENLPDLELKGFVTSELGILYGSLGESEKAIQYYEASYQIYTEAGKTLLAVNNLRNAAINYWGLGKTDEAIATYHELLDRLENKQQAEMQFSAQLGLARIYAHKDSQDFDLAMAHLANAETLVSQVEQHHIPSQFLVAKASILKDLAQYDQALAIIAQALEVMHNKKFNLNPLIEARLLVLRSEIFRLTGRFKEAYETYLRVYEVNMQEFESRQTKAVAELRLELESKRVDIERNLLENKNKIESISLKEAKEAAENKQFYIYLSAIAALIFAFLLVQLLKSQMQLLKLTNIDSLTNVLNYYRFMHLAKLELTKAEKNKSSLSLVLIGCDFFKKINDDLGHAKGDEALIVIGELGKEHFASSSFFARYGGDEFVALLPNTDIDNAELQAQSLQKLVNNHIWNSENNGLLSISCSVVSTISVDSYEFDPLISKAHSLLYRAQENRRNKLCV